MSVKLTGSLDENNRVFVVNTGSSTVTDIDIDLEGDCSALENPRELAPRERVAVAIVSKAMPVPEGGRHATVKLMIAGELADARRYTWP